MNQIWIPDDVFELGSTATSDSMNEGHQHTAARLQLELLTTSETKLRKGSVEAIDAPRSSRRTFHWVSRVGRPLVTPLMQRRRTGSCCMGPRKSPAALPHGAKSRRTQGPTDATPPQNQRLFLASPGCRPHLNLVGLILALTANAVLTCDPAQRGNLG